MPITIDIFFILLSLCAILLCAIFIAVIILLTRKQKSWDSGEIGMLQNQILSLNKTLDEKLTQSNSSLNKNMSESLRASTNIADSSNKNIEAITKKLTELSETNKQIKDIRDRLEWLESILKNPKRRWNLWEYFLRELLENVFKDLTV